MRRRPRDYARAHNDSLPQQLYWHGMSYVQVRVGKVGRARARIQSTLYMEGQVQVE